MNEAEPGERADTVADGMAAADHGRDVQRIQTHYRTALVSGWNITPGSRVLELGCGQGDMTAVLADRVGPSGHVTAIDIADPSYGAPVTLGESAASLMAGPLGSRISFRFTTDVLDPAVDFPADAFDCVVLAHCSWYFGSLGRLQDTLTRLRSWSQRLLFAEWDLTPTSGDQLAHLLAVLIQGQIEAGGSHGSGNIRTPFSLDTLLRMLPHSGWHENNTSRVSTAQLHDGDWEVAACLGMAASATRTSELPEALRHLITSQVDVLKAMALPHGNLPLPAYSVTAN